MSRTVTVDELPPCDFCPDGRPAGYDARTIYGTWANMCLEHLKLFGVGLGTGKGQELVLDGEENT